MEGKIHPLRRRELDNVNTADGTTNSVSLELHRTKNFQPNPLPVCYHFEDLAKTPMEDQTLIPRPLNSPSIPTFPTVPVPASLDIPVDPEKALVVTRSKSGYLRKTSQKSLSTIAEHTPEVYRPSEAPLATLPVDASEDEATTSEAPPADQEIMTTQSEVNSIDSHHSLSTIYIKPSPQLASMQAVGEHLCSTHDAVPYGAWTRSKVFLTQSQHSLPNTTYMPQTSPRSVFKTLGEVEEDSSNDTRPAFYKPQSIKWTEGKDIRMGDATQSTTSFERSTKWIENYLVRRAEADHAEEEARRKQEKATKWDLPRMNSFNKLKRRISGKQESGFEPRSSLQLHPHPEYTHQPAETQELTPPPTPPPEKAVPELYHLFPKPPAASSIAHLLVPRAPPPPPPSTPIPFGRPEKPKSPPSRPLLSTQRFHSVSGASLSRFLLRRKALGVDEPPKTNEDMEDESFSRRHSMSSRSVNLGRRASVGVKEIVAKFEKFGGKEKEGNSRRDSVRDVM